jgi:hypothetical protein
MSPVHCVTHVSGPDPGKHGERGRIRTCDPCLKRALLYQLSYAPIERASHSLRENQPLYPLHTRCTITAFVVSNFGLTSFWSCCIAVML